MRRRLGRRSDGGAGVIIESGGQVRPQPQGRAPSPPPRRRPRLPGCLSVSPGPAPALAGSPSASGSPLRRRPGIDRQSSESAAARRRAPDSEALARAPAGAALGLRARRPARRCRVRAGPTGGRGAGRGARRRRTGGRGGADIVIDSIQSLISISADQTESVRLCSRSYSESRRGDCDYILYEHCRLRVLITRSNNIGCACTSAACAA